MPQKLTFTPADSRKADRQGWNLFNVGDDRHPRYEIQRLDTLANFNGDHAALVFVLHHHRQGHCRRAIQSVFGF